LSSRIPNNFYIERCDMIKEWNTPWNPFNSAKALLWREWFEGIAKQDFLPPVTVDTDPSNRCNFNCPWCNAFDYMGGKKQDITKEQLFRLADFYAEWGTHSTCVAGGGEPLMNAATPDFLKRLKLNGIEAGLITNGSLVNDEIAEVIASTCRWVGISMDAGKSETYMKAKGIKDSNMFNKVLGNFEKIAKEIKKQDTNCDLCYKYLLHPMNADEIYLAATIAKQIGVKDFHLRPVGWDNLSKTKDKDRGEFLSLLNTIDEQIELSMKLEDENFRFFGIRHKFTPTFERKINFSRCWAAPLILTFGADGNCHLCFDIRGRKDMILCSHDPDPREVLKYWNTDKHKKMLQSICVEDCPRCTFGPYNEIVEQVFIKDSMCRYFP